MRYWRAGRGASRSSLNPITCPLPSRSRCSVQPELLLRDSPTLAHPPPAPPPLSLSRVRRLLRPLRASLQALAQALGEEHVQAQQPPARTRNHHARLDPDYADSSSSSSSKRRRSSSHAHPHHPAKRSALLGPAQPDSSPFKRAARRRPATTYGGGSRRGAAGAPPARSQSATPVEEQDQEPLPSRARLTSADLAARLAAPEAHLATKAQQRALAVFRAYGNVLEAVFVTPSSSGPPSLGEVAARTLGWGIEADLMAFAPPALDSESDGDGGAEMERTASVQELQQEAAAAQDEWYESCPPSAIRWMLGDHATAIVVDALETSDVAFAVWECCFDLCLAHGAHSEAARLHIPLVTALLATPRNPTPPPPLLALLRRTPAPSALLHTALVPALLRSTFAQRSFFHSALNISGQAGEGEHATGLLEALCTVAVAMLRSIRIATTAPNADADPEEEEVEVDPASARAVSDQVRRRVAVQARAALACVLSPGEGGLEAVKSVREAVERVLAASFENADESDDGEADGHSASDQLHALGNVCDLASALSSRAPLTVPTHNPHPGALEDALRRFLPHLLPLSPDAAAQLLILGAHERAVLAALSGCSAVSSGVRAEAARRLEAEGDDGVETDYDEPFTVVRAPAAAQTASSGWRRRRVVPAHDLDASATEDEDEGLAPAKQGRPRAFNLVGRRAVRSSSSSGSEASRSCGASASVGSHTARSRSRSATLEAPPHARTPVLVLSPSPSPSPPPPEMHAAATRATSEADDLDLLQSAAKKRPRRGPVGPASWQPPSQRRRLGGKAVATLAGLGRDRQRWAVEESEDELAI